jgi:hypothetical protein
MSDLRGELGRWKKFNALQGGRDKQLRFIQHWLKFYAAYSGQKQYNAIVSLIGESRKLFRFGKVVEFITPFYDAVMGTLGGSAKVTLKKIITLVSVLANLQYFWLDSLLWLNYAKLVTLADKKAASLGRNRAWAGRIITSILLLVLKLKGEKTWKGADMRKLVANCMDLPLPLTSLGYLGLTAQSVGLIGMSTSVITAFDLYPAASK